jgi:1-phosphatidylinositol phosphodiesterase
MRSLLLLCVALAALTVGCTIVQSDPGTPGYVSSGSAALEVNVDRPGSDYRSFDLATPSPEQCRDTCMVEPQCVAFTYVNPGLQGPSARCWLKSAVPNATPNACCTSGVKNAPAAATYQQSSGFVGTPPVQEAPPAPPPSPPLTPTPPTPPSSGWRGMPPEGRHRDDRAQLEVNINRRGSDYSNFDLAQARPHLCKEACLADARCLAFTYVNPGVQGPNARCWLKDSVPNATPEVCCTSGVKGASAGMAGPAPGAGFEVNVDRPGYDFSNFDLPQPRPELCRDACLRDNQCRAFTYVNPGVQGPSARCWLKMSVPTATTSNCCISGVK